MHNQEISKEYNKRINAVVNFILKNLNKELSLIKLAGIANYSPYHFQRIFKQIIGESPKQFIIRIRLENAAHTLGIHRHKPISEIAIENGFTSPAVFARAFKNYFGVSAEKLKSLTPKDKIELRQKKYTNGEQKNVAAHYLNNQFGENNQYDVNFWTKNLKVEIKRMPLAYLIFINAPLSDTNKIQESFKRIIQLADTYNLLSQDSKFIGIVNPHQGLYRAAITINGNQKLASDISEITIEAGKFATYKIKGDTLQTFHSLHAFYELWLPLSGYRIAAPNGFEILSQNPATVPYYKIEREIYIAIEPT